MVLFFFYFSDWAMPSARGQTEELSEGGKTECKTPSLRMDKDSEASSRWARLLRKKTLPGGMIRFHSAAYGIFKRLPRHSP